MIRIHLSRILGEKRWYQSELARMTNIRPNTINAMYNEITKRISLDDLDKLCNILECNVSDILEYVPEQKGRKCKGTKKML